MTKLKLRSKIILAALALAAAFALAGCGQTGGGDTYSLNGTWIDTDGVRTFVFDGAQVRFYSDMQIRGNNEDGFLESGTFSIEDDRIAFVWTVLNRGVMGLDGATVWELRDANDAEEMSFSRTDDGIIIGRVEYIRQ